MSPTQNQTWDLEAIYPGGSRSELLLRQIDQLEAAIGPLKLRVLNAQLPSSLEGPEHWRALLNDLDEIYKHLGNAFAYVGCLMAQDVKDQPAKLLRGRLSSLAAAVDTIWYEMRARFEQTPDQAWTALMADPRFAPVAFPLNEARERARQVMDPARESLAGDLAADGPSAWYALQQLVSGRITIPVQTEGEVRDVSVGQANNLLSDPDRALRTAVFAKYEEAFSRDAELFASALNSVAGFRLTLWNHRGWDSYLTEPLAANRMTRETLEAMWSAVAAARPRLAGYLQRKGRLLGVTGPAWYDLSAPLGEDQAKVSYDDAAAFVIDNFRTFSPRLADFAQRAFTQRWIEAEDRPGKRQGGFCTSFPVAGQSRVFMTYGGQRRSIATLAHELGHAFHNEVLTDLPSLVQEFSMNVAETASTFAELIVRSAVMRQATTPEERIVLLDGDLSSASTYLMNIYARFLFECRFYELRPRGPVGVDQLNELMLQSQKEAYADTLSLYHPLLWASRHHFYRDPPFYNFPYTFGFLFSAGIFARASAEGPAFEQSYIALLRDTGRMTVEDLASRHLGVDLRQPEFWESAVAAAAAGCTEFLDLTAGR